MMIVRPLRSFSSSAMIPRAPADGRLTSIEMARVAGVSVATLARLVRAGVVEPDVAGGFTVANALRLRRMLRLHADLRVNLLGAAIIVDLMERLERLEALLGREG
jgi:chaperone modulatory protein CbpM